MENTELLADHAGQTVADERPRITKEQMIIKLYEDISANLGVIENQLQNLKHGQKTRLIMAMASYPMTDTKFDNEPDLAETLASWKRLNDAQVALGVESVFDSLQKRQQAAESFPAADQPLAEEVPVEEAKPKRKTKKEVENE